MYLSRNLRNADEQILISIVIDIVIVIVSRFAHDHDHVGKGGGTRCRNLGVDTTSKFHSAVTKVRDRTKCVIMHLIGCSLGHWILIIITIMTITM